MALALSNGQSFTLSAAQKSERNILTRLRRSHATQNLYQDLWAEREAIEAVTAHHVRSKKPSACVVQETNAWMKGQFNICIPVHVHEADGTVSKKIFRCPMPHKVGEQNTPGAVEEKVRAEVASYAYIERNCPEIRVPRLSGFGLSEFLQFTHCENGAGFFEDQSGCKFDRPYLLLDYIDSHEGSMLSDTLHEFRDSDRTRMENLFHGISRIMLSLARATQPNIGSLRFNDSGSITVETRPLLCANTILESEGAPRVLDRTYETTGSFIDDLLRFRRAAFRAQPNAVNDEEDCYLQMSHMVFLEDMKALINQHHSEGLFVLQFQDLHASNIFVDDEWNIIALIDLEYICALPPSMMNVPYWLSVDAIDDVSEQMDAFSEMREAFMHVFRDEEESFGRSRDELLALTMEKAWDSQSYWFYCCFTSVDGITCCVEDHLFKALDIRLSPDEEMDWAKSMAARWSSDVECIVRQKLDDKAAYNEDVARHYETRMNGRINGTGVPTSEVPTLRNVSL